MWVPWVLTCRRASSSLSCKAAVEVLSARATPRLGMPSLPSLLLGFLTLILIKHGTMKSWSTSFFRPGAVEFGYVWFVVFVDVCSCTYTVVFVQSVVGYILELWMWSSWSWTGSQPQYYVACYGPECMSDLKRSREKEACDSCLVEVLPSMDPTIWYPKRKS